MIIALYALALAMIVGGLFAAVLGWDIVLVERGWTMVISGIIGASSGALLVGITVIVSRLTRIQEELGRVQLSLEDDIETVVVPTSAERARGRIIDDVASASAGAAVGGLFASREASRASAVSEPVPANSDQLDLPIEEARLTEHEEQVPFELRSVPHDDTAPEPFVEPDLKPSPEAPEARVPDFLFAERYRETTVTEFDFPERETPSFSTSPDDELADEVPLPVDEPDDDHEVFEVVEERTVEVVSTVDRDLAEETSTSDVEEGPPTVIGTYNSGDNKYVMYSDGSIEAETPQGFFRFASLDELKEFIAAGGENNPSAAT